MGARTTGGTGSTSRNCSTVRPRLVSTKAAKKVVAKPLPHTFPPISQRPAA